MDVQFQHANPSRGHESSLLYFRDDVRDDTTVVLVDAVTGVDEYLSAILLTHAHLDHFGT